MTLLAIGTCLIIAAAAESAWKSPPLLRPFLLLGRRSYEIYLTHMFVVFAFFDLFMSTGKPMRAVPILFVGTVLVAAVLGELIARFYSEPLNQILRGRFKEGRRQLGAVAEIQPTA
jgi:peptidoglycan/LPS O-acetylase OafA/YrhL